MIDAPAFLNDCANRGFSLFTGVPCSYLGGLITGAVMSPRIRYVPASNEGDAVAIAAGSRLGGQSAVCMFQNSGLGNAISPLASLTAPFRIPVLLVISHRGAPERSADEPQHALMGKVTPSILDLLEIEWERCPTEQGMLSGVLDRAEKSIRERSMPFALIVQKGTVSAAESTDSLASPDTRPAITTVPPRPTSAALTRGEVLKTVLSNTSREKDILIATTGYTGRELFALSDASNHLYMVGSMGCAVSLGLGIAIASPRHRVIVLDGDGSALMRLGALAAVGAERPPNLLHLLLDNGQHESTGGQTTASMTTDLAAVAAAAFYPRVLRAVTRPEVAEIVHAGTDELAFVHIPTRPGVPQSLPRPSSTPDQVAERLRAHIAKTR